MGGALGFAIGTGLNALKGYAAEKLQQKSQHDQMWDEFMFQNMTQNPQFAQSPQGQKEIKRMFGEHADAAMTMLNLAGQARQQFAQGLNGQSGAPGGGGPQFKSLGDFNNEINRIQAIRDQQTDPRLIAIADDHIKNLRAEAATYQKQQEFGQRQQQAQQFHQDSENDRALMRQIQVGNREFENWYKTQTLAEKKGRDAEAQGNKLQTGFNNHLTQLTNRKLSLMNSLQAKLQAGNLDAKSAQPIVDAYNRSVDQMGTAAKKLGIEFDPSEYRLSINPGEKGYFHTSIGGVKPSIEEGAAAAGDSLVGVSTEKPDGTYELDGKKYVVKGGKIAGLAGG